MGALGAEATFSQTVREAEANAHSGYCRVKPCIERIHSFHHRLPNTKANNKNYPLFLQSQFNCAGVCLRHHEHHASVPGLDISEREAAAFEAYLRDNFKEI